jgi:hypothetical protein
MSALAQIMVGDYTIPYWIFIILIIIGLLMVFFGRAIWDIVMSIIGGIIGSMIGFVIGFIFFQWIGAIICMFIFGFIGSILFKYLIRSALALLCGIIAAGLLWYAMGTPKYADFAVWGLIVMIAVFIPCYIFIEQLVSVLTALIGGALLGFGIYGLTLEPWLAIGVGVGMWILGSVIQILALGDYDKVSDRV